jgi:UDP-N-acetylmuramyl pentapeptide phosphotransferase/UDP-N-acetylglucosamine-1-phosphate transferase
LLRLVIHFLAAFLVLHYGNLWLIELTFPGITCELPLVLQTFLSLLFVVWMVNLYNFMDGMDGFAGGMALFGFGTFALLGAVVGEWFFTALNLLIASAVGGFLVFNFPPAKIFMGDAGSSSLGFLVACFSLWADHADIIPLWMAMLLFSPFIIDATVTLLRRILYREKFWQPHKTHYYQRLVQLGWGHRRTVLWEYKLMAACSLSTITASELPVYAQWLMLLIWVTIYMGLMYLVTQLEKHRVKS